MLNERKEPESIILELTKDLRSKHRMQVEIIRGDKSGKNQALKILYKQERICVKFTYTTPGVSQQNGRVETIVILYGRV